LLDFISVVYGQLVHQRGWAFWRANVLHDNFGVV
jgi:hypothetical protein